MFHHILGLTRNEKKNAFQTKNVACQFHRENSLPEKSHYMLAILFHMNSLLFSRLLASDIDVKITGDINSLLLSSYIPVSDYFTLWRGGAETSEL